MEPGVPDPTSKEAHLGMYNLDRELRFWATPPYAESLLAGMFISPAPLVLPLGVCWAGVLPVFQRSPAQPSVTCIDGFRRLK